MKNINKEITGNTKVCGVIGDPIEHTLSPFIHNTIDMKLNGKMIYVPFHVQDGRVEEAVKGAHALGIRGINVTMPHKKKVIPCLKELDEQAKKVGAVNTLVYTPKGYVGYNTDAIGLKMALDHQEFVYDDQDVAIIGSGGAAYAVIVAIASSARSIHLFNRTKENAIKVREHFKAFYKLPIVVHDWEEKVEDVYGMVVQTTGIGMGKYENQMPLCAEYLLGNARQAIDLIYNPSETPFLAYAKKRGCKCMNGFDMLFYQAVKAYEYMHGVIEDQGLISKIKEEIQSQL